MQSITERSQLFPPTLVTSSSQKKNGLSGSGRCCQRLAYDELLGVVLGFEYTDVEVADWSAPSLCFLLKYQSLYMGTADLCIKRCTVRVRWYGELAKAQRNTEQSFSSPTVFLHGHTLGSRPAFVGRDRA